MQQIPVNEKTPLNFHLTLRRFIAFGEDAANYFDGTVFRKVLRLQGQLRLLQIKMAENAVKWRIFPEDIAGQNHECERHVRHILGLEFDLPAFYQSVRADPVLVSLIDRFYGLRPTLTANPFEILVTSISAQQINLAFAFKVRSRLIRQFGDKYSHQGRDYFAFPTPAALASVPPQELRQLQFTQRKAEYIVGLAQAIESGALNLQQIQHKTPSEITSHLTAIRGLGRWTVDWCLARGLGLPAACPAGDLAVRKAVQKFYFKGEKKDEQSIRDRAALWGNFANLACHYLLAGLTIQEK